MDGNLRKGGQCQTSQENGDMMNMRFFKAISSRELPEESHGHNTLSDFNVKGQMVLFGFHC